MNRMNSCELASSVTIIACAIAKCLPKEELPILASVLGQLASTLATIIVQDEIIDKGNNLLPAILPISDANTPLLDLPFNNQF